MKNYAKIYKNSISTEHQSLWQPTCFYRRTTKAKLGVLEKREKILDTLAEYTDKFTNLLKKKEDAEKTITDYKETFIELEKKIKGDDK